jgi:hypothetical protein
MWRDVVPRRARSPERLVLLEQALRALDRADQARAAVDEGELMSKTQTTGAVHLNPLLKVEREARAQFLTAWSQLSLGWCPEIDGRLVPHE